MKSLNYLWSLIRYCCEWITAALFLRVYFGRHSVAVPNGSIVFFPCCSNILCCGLSGIVSFKPGKMGHSDLLADLPVDDLRNTLLAVESCGYSACKKSALSITDHYLGGGSGCPVAVQSGTFTKKKSYLLFHLCRSKLAADPFRDFRAPSGPDSIRIGIARSGHGSPFGR